MNPYGTQGTAACSIGLEIDGGDIITVIPKGASLPARSRRLFTTVNDRQEAVEIHVVSYGGGFEAVSIGRFLLAGIASANKGEPRIQVVIEIDADGLIHASAKDLDAGIEQRAVFPRIPAPGEIRSQRTRLFTLARRLKREAEALPRKQGQALQAEADELVARSYEGMVRNDPREIKGCIEALETLLGEVSALRSERAAPHGKAGLRV